MWYWVKKWLAYELVTAASVPPPVRMLPAISFEFMLGDFQATGHNSWLGAVIPRIADTT